MTITLNKSTARNVQTSSGDQNIEFKDFVVDPSSINHLLESLIKSYGDPVEAAFRETLSNAVDATVEAGVNTPVEIHMPNYMDPYLVIKDHGIGMSPETVDYIYRSFGKSTKVDNFSVIGAKGLGSKAPLAIADSFTLETVKDGMKTIASVEQSSTGGGLSILFQGATDEANGTIVSICLDNDQIRQLESSISEHKYCFPVPVVLQNGKSINVDLSQSLNYTINIDGFDVQYHFLMDITEYSPFRTVMINVGGIIYTTKLPADIDTLAVPLYSGLIIDLPIGSVTFPASRDSIEMSNKSINTLTSAIMTENLREVNSKLLYEEFSKLSLESFVQKYSASIRKEELPFDAGIKENEQVVDVVEYKSGVASQAYIPRYNTMYTRNINLEEALFTLRDSSIVVHKASYIFTEKEVESLKGYTSKEFRVLLKDYTKTVLGTNITYVLIVKSDRVRDLILAANKEAMGLSSLGDADALLKNYLEDVKEYRRTHQTTKKKYTIPTVNVGYILDDNYSKVDITCLDSGTYYYDSTINWSIYNKKSFESYWWFKLFDSDLYSFKYPIIILNPRKSLQKIPNLKLVDLDSYTQQKSILRNITKGAHRKYLLGLYKYRNSCRNLRAITYVIENREEILDSTNKYMPGKLKPVLTKISKYYEKEVIDYETLGSICNDLGYDFSNSKIKVVKDFEPFQDTIDDLGICTFNQNKEKKIKTIFWAMNTLYKY